MPTTETPDQMLENAIARMLRGETGMRLRSIAMRPDCRLDVAGLWGVLRINRYTQMYGTARLTDMAEYLRIPFEVLEPTFSRLVTAGYAGSDGDRLWLTPAGAQQVGYVHSLLLAWLVDKLGRSPGFEGARTAKRCRPPWNALRIAFSPNVIGMTRSRPRRSRRRPASRAEHSSPAAGEPGRTITP